MKKLVTLSALVLVACLAGCRLEDVRTVTVSLPKLTAADTNTVVKALARYAGVKRETIAFDLEKRTVTMAYDSMQIAKTNIRRAIESAGVPFAE